MSITMYDAVDVAQIPRGALAVAGYVDGHWATFPSLERDFPHAHRLSIAVSAMADADCLDIENGDASPAEAPGWVRRQLARRLRLPVVYSSVSGMAAVIAELGHAGIPRTEYRLWTAHYTGTPHRCTHRCWPDFRDSAGATQYTDKALERNLDASIVYGPGWFPRVVS
jgi:hypothetical protein